MVRGQESTRGGVGLSEADEVKMGQLEARERDRGAGRVGNRKREGDVMDRGEDGRGGGEVRDNEAGVSQEAR